MTEHPILWKVRTRWAAVGAAVAVVLGAGGIAVSGATNPQLVPSQTTITPCRIMDTRASSQVGPRSTPLGLSTTHTIQVTGRNGSCTLPRDVDSVVINLTVANIRADGFITVFPAGTTRPNAASINYGINQKPVSNSVTAALSSSGQLSFFAFNGPVDLIADVVAYTTRARTTSADLAQNRWDKDRGRPVTVTVPGLAALGPIAFDGSRIWVSNNALGQVIPLDPSTAATGTAVTSGSQPLAMAAEGTHLWVANGGSSTLSRIDTVTGAKDLADVTGLSTPAGVLFDGSSIWVTKNGTDTVLQLDPATGAVRAEVAVGDGPKGLAFDGTNIWVTNATAGTVSRINATTAVKNPTDITVGTGPGAILFDGSTIWVANRTAGSLSRIVAATGVKVTPDLTGITAPSALAFDGTRLWVANSGVPSVTRVLVATATVEPAVPAPAPAAALTFDGTSVWATLDDGIVQRFRAAQ